MNREEHRALRESLGAYVLGHLEPDRELALRAHLDGCAACRADLAEIEPVVGKLASADLEQIDVTPAPPPGLGDEIVRQVRLEQRSTVQRRMRRRHSRVAVGIAAAAVGAVLAGSAGYIAGSAGSPDVPREPVAVHAVAADLEASATVVPHTWGVEITLVAGGFEPGAVYRVVVIDDAGRRVSAGEFIGTGDSTMTCNLNSSVLRADASGFDVLDARGQAVLRGQL